MEKPKIMVIDDEESMCRFMQIMLQKEGYDVSSTVSSKEALEEIKNKKDYDLVIADLMMPEMNGLELLSRAKNIQPDINFIVMTAYASVDTAIEALKKGAFDYITKPFKVDEIKFAIKKSLEQRKITEENIKLKKQLKKEFGLDNLIGSSPEMIQLKKLIERVADTDSTVLIQGESGTGKELVAKAIHQLSRRADQPFITINCAALPETLLESEVFGHVKGSFTGALRDKEGLFQVANRGTFFMDEIGMTPPAIQVKLLRVLDEQQFTPVGGTKPVEVDVRLIAATNSNLEEEVKLGNFRSDLYYRLNVIPVQIQPLRERKSDIELLIRYFIKKYCEKMMVEEKGIAPESMQSLIDYSWPGNVRELENIIERAVLLTTGELINQNTLPENILQNKPLGLVQPAQPELPGLESIEKAYIFWVLNQTGWQKSKASQILGIDTSTLYRKIERYNLKEK
ncbi:MAG: sigma-54 dependent transcriptional regulator [candidate division Zixibacteria bacterium]|nr:sigma-54 dependent transcriptional regulator [candidate division Zixibacteria bacterium]